MQEITKHFMIEAADIYHSQAKACLSSHQLMHFMKCPHLWRKEHLGLVPESNRTEFMIGEATHVRILEGRDAFDARYVWDSPINPTTGAPYGSTTKKYTDWKKAQKRIVLTRTQVLGIEELTAGVKRNPHANKLLSSGQAEAVVRGFFEGLKCQIRIDWFNPDHGIVDLKTCSDLDWFEYDAKKYKYDIQTTFYREVLQAVTGYFVPVHIIAVEKQEPYRCGVWEVCPETFHVARGKIIAAIKRFKACKANDHWPTGFEDVRQLQLI
jgi:hypothetical protein